MQSVKAFTMIEIIMVVVFIGMMAAFVVPNYSKAIDKAVERTATNNLLVVYSGQRLKGQGNYQVCNNVAQINTNLNLSIITANGVTYSCPAPGTTVNTFVCEAARAGGFTLRVSDPSLDANAPRVCCAAGTCLTGAPAC